VSLERAEGASLDRVEALLTANGLPHGDIRTAPAEFFIARSNSDPGVVGVGGVEQYGADGLLRSIAVAEPYRGKGYGTALCAELERYARGSGVERLYLLTTTAAAFFRQRGYETVPRSDAPASVRSTTEFAELCPASATCMRRDLR
jgi:amino-acid N-acetyltransferase